MPLFKNWFGDWENGQRTENSDGSNGRAVGRAGRGKGKELNEVVSGSLDDARSNGTRDSRDNGSGRQTNSPNSSKDYSQTVFNLDPKTGEPRAFSQG